MTRDWNELRDYLKVQGLATENGAPTLEGIQVAFMIWGLIATQETMRANELREKLNRENTNPGTEWNVESMPVAHIEAVSQMIYDHPDYHEALKQITDTMPND